MSAITDTDRIAALSAGLTADEAEVAHQLGLSHAQVRRARREEHALVALRDDAPNVARGVVALDAGLAKLPTEFRLFARGTNRTKKGDFLFDDAAAKAVQRNADTWGLADGYSLDYQHDALNAAIPGHERIAAGWFKPEVRNGELWATNVRWTPRAAKALSEREFRYVSPTFRHEGGRVVELINVALTNTPATHGIAPLVAASR